MNVITSQNLANALLKLVAVDALPSLFAELQYPHCMTRDFEPVVAAAGEVVSVQTEHGPVGVTINKLAESTFTIPDVTKVIAVPDLLRLYMRPSVMVVAEQIDLSCNDALCGDQYHNRRFKDFDDAVDYVSRFAHRTEEISANLSWPRNRSMKLKRQGVEYITASDGGFRTLLEGRVVNYRGVMCFTSPSGNLNASRRPVLFSKSAGVIAMRRLPRDLRGMTEYGELGNFGLRVAMTYNPGTLTQTFNIAVQYGVTLARPDCAAILEDENEDS
jgi:hypothetical protein